MNAAPPELRDEIRALLVETLMLPVPPAELTDERPLFGEGSVGLDSVDALQLVVALDKQYGLKITDAEMARQVLGTVTSIAGAVAGARKKAASTATPVENPNVAGQ